MSSTLRTHRPVDPTQPIHRCLGCGVKAFTLYCDSCAPPIIPFGRTYGDSFGAQADRTWNGVPYDPDGSEPLVAIVPRDYLRHQL